MDEQESRNSLWLAIRDTAFKMSGKCGVYISENPNQESLVIRQNSVPTVKTWQLLEGLNILAVLMKSDRVVTEHVCNIFGKTGPIHFIEDGKNRYLWAQPTLKGCDSALSGRPDIVVSSESERPSSFSILRIIESKCCKNIGAHQIRAEFGKAHDLKVMSYLIWSYYTPSSRVIEGAKKLGLDLIALGFDTTSAKEFSMNPELLATHVANTLEVSRREKKFVKMLSDASKELLLKSSI